MNFSFSYKVRAVNLLILSMINIYRSIVGVVNIIFTASMILLAVRYYSEAGWKVRVPITMGILFFPLIQPLMIFLRSKRIVTNMPADMRMTFDSKGMSISTSENNSTISYSDLRSVVRISKMIIIYTKSRQGFILDRKILAGRGNELYDFLVKKVGS